MHLPPFTYNDNRLMYGEQCFYYNGGYDNICLSINTINAKRKVGNGGDLDKKREILPWVDITVRSQLIKINKIPIHSDVMIQNIKGEYSPGNISGNIIKNSKLPLRKLVVNILELNVKPNNVDNNDDNTLNIIKKENKTNLINISANLINIKNKKI